MHIIIKLTRIIIRVNQADKHERQQGVTTCSLLNQNYTNIEVILKANLFQHEIAESS